MSLVASACVRKIPLASGHTECRDHEKRTMTVAKMFCFVPCMYSPITTALWGRHERPLAERDWGGERPGSPFDIHLLWEDSRVQAVAMILVRTTVTSTSVGHQGSWEAEKYCRPQNVHLSTAGKRDCVGLCRKGRLSLQRKPFNTLPKREMTLAYQGSPMTSLGKLSG